MKPMTKISRRTFIESGVKMAGLAVTPGRWLRENSDGRCPRRDPSGPTAGHPARDDRGRFFGVQTHFGQYRTGVNELLDLIKDARLGWIRDEVYWSEIEKEKGIFRFPAAYDDYLKAARTRDLQVLLILDFGNSLYSGSEKSGPATEVERRAFARYCREVVVRYKPLGVRHYEIWNEPNASTFWKPRPNPGDYAKLLEAAYQSCKETDPDSVVLGCSTAGTDLDFIGGVLAAGGGRFMDAVSFHPYGQPLPPEKKILTDLVRLKGLAPEKPLWISEVGYPTFSGASGVDEESQANYLVRTFLLARTSPAVERVSWYDFQNDGEDRAEGEFNFGLVRTDRTPKPAYLACRTMASLVRDLPLAEFRIVGNKYFLRFEEGKEWRMAVWRLGGAETTEIACANGLYRVIERDGESRTAEARESFLEISVSEKPRYILPAVTKSP
jgi:hypothetical protein